MRNTTLVALAWLVVAAVHAAGAAFVIPPLLLVAAASLLRGGRTLLDRLVLAAGALLGATCLAGLVFAWWPWGLHPVAAGGTAATALILLAARTGRGPSLPRPRPGDAVTAAAAGIAGLVAAWPVWCATPAQRLAIMLDGEDFARHAAVFDAIRRTGGYLFADHARAERLVYSGMVDYPQGSHLLAALLDGYARSSSGVFGGGTAMLQHYLAYSLGGYALLALVLAWAAHWIGAGALGHPRSPARHAALAGLVAAACAAGDMLDLLSFGYPSQVLGLAEAVLLLALLARPLARTGDQLLLVAALLVAVGFTYYLYLPPVGLAALLWLAGRRRRLARRPAALGLAALAAAAAAGPLVHGLLRADQASALFTAGSLRLGREAPAALAVLVAAGLLTRRGRRSRIWRRYALVFAPVAAYAAVLLAGQRLFGAGGGGGYYASKALYLVFALLLAGAGAVALHRPPRRAPGSLPALVAVVALAGAWGGDLPYRTGDGNRARTWLRGPDAARTAQAEVVLAAYARLPGATPVIVVGDDRGYESYRMTLFLSTLQRTGGDTAAAIYHRLPVTDPGRLDASVAAMRGPVRLLALSAAAERRAVEVRERHPGSRIEVLRV